MHQLYFDAPGSYVWRELPEPTLEGPGEALVRPVAVAACDLDVAVARGLAPLPPGYAQGHEGIAEVLSVGDEVTGVRPGDRVIVPFQVSCGQCPPCRRGVTGSCGSVPPRSMYGLGAIAGRDEGGFLSDVVRVPFADAMLVRVLPDLDPVAVASLSDNIPDGWRCVGPYAAELASLAPADRRVLVLGGLSLGLYAAAMAVFLGARADYVDTDPTRLAAAERLGAVAHDLRYPDRSWTPYPLTVNTTADPKKLGAAVAATWPDGVCTDTGIYYEPSVAVNLLAWYSNGVRFVTGRVNARSAIPSVLELLGRGLDLRPVVESTVDWDEAPAAWSGLRGKTVILRS
jgi:threonine dehydrogenase-like Zn-dependent dehydrogenase